MVQWNTEPQQRPKPSARVICRVLVALAAWVGLSAILWAYTESDYNACRNPLVAVLAANSCTEATFWHSISQFCMWAGSIGIAAILVMIRRRR